MKREDAQKRNEGAFDQPVKALPHKRLSQLLAELTTGPVTPLPESEEWTGVIERITTESVVQEVSEETFDYFLEVLPPKYMGLGGCFVFAEGAEPFRFFWRRSGKFFCRRLSWQETKEFCRLARGGDHVS
jgi:hypothetical protein